MTLEEASKITNLWGKYLEHTNGKMMRLFLTKIPQSLLPYPKDVIEEACNVMAEHYFNQGNHKAEMIFKETAAFLLSYVDDEEALLEAAKRFNDPKWRKAIIKGLDSSDITAVQEKGL